MKLLQHKVTSLNTSVEELWLYQLENNCDAIFLQETAYIEGKPLGHFKHWKNRGKTECLPTITTKSKVLELELLFLNNNKMYFMMICLGLIQN